MEEEYCWTYLRFSKEMFLNTFLFCNGRHWSKDGNFTFCTGSFSEILNIWSLNSESEMDFWCFVVDLGDGDCNRDFEVTRLEDSNMLPSGGVIGSSLSFSRYRRLKVENSDYVFITGAIFKEQYSKLLPERTGWTVCLRFISE